MELPTAKSSPVRDIRDYTFLIYGQPKAGKTTFCSNFEGALFIATEPGHKFQEIYKVDPKNWRDIQMIAKHLLNTEHDFKTIVIDTADNAYKMCGDYVKQKNNIQHESDLGFGKGYALIKDEFMRVINALAQKGFGIVFISHAQTREIEENGIKRAFTDTTLGGSASKVISGLCDFIFYASIDANGKRTIRTKANPSVNAGDRSGKLPEIMPLDFKTLENALTKNEGE